MALTKFNFNSFDVTTAASKGLAFNSNANGFETSSATSMILIKTLTAYPVYMFKFINIHPGTDDKNFQFNMSVDTGSNYNVTKTTTVFKANHDEGDSATNLTYDTGEDLAQGTGFQTLGNGVGADNDQSLSGTLHLFNPSDTTFVKHFMSTIQYYAFNNYTNNFYVAGYGNTTSAVDAVQFKFNSGNIDSGTIKLYGIKDS